MTEFYQTPLESCGKSREYERTIDRNESKGKIHITLPLGLLHTNSARSSAAPPPNKIPELHVNSRRGEEPCAEALNSFKTYRTCRIRGRQQDRLLRPLAIFRIIEW